ncbi:MAG: TIGR00730 family Rossman fold protein [Methylocella sp.]
MASKHNVIEAGSRLVRNICVYCGSAQGAGPSYEAAAEKLGQAMAKASISLVYGGGAHGLMGALARSVLSNGGRVTGIIPDFLVGREGPLPGLQECLVVGSLHERKRLMFERADAFVALPGGIGTLEELTEQLSWVQLERHTKPVVIADIDGFWQPLLRLFGHMRERRFIQSSLEVRYLVAEKIEDIVPMIETAAAKAAVLGTRKETVDPRL